MANAVPVNSKPVEIPAKSPAEIVAEKLAQNDAQGLKADPSVAPSVAPANPVVNTQNAGTPDQPVRTMSTGVMNILNEVANQGAREPKSVVELPGGVVRTDY